MLRYTAQNAGEVVALLDLQEYLKFIIGLLALLNPLGAIPIFLALTDNLPAAARNDTARVSVFSMFIILVVALLMGEALLRFFGISLHSFRVGGGILIMTMAIAMLHARTSPAKHTPEEFREAANRDSIAVVPLAMPILAGPGSISTVILFAHRGHGFAHLLVTALVMAMMSLALYATMRFSVPIARRFGQTGINIITRVMGLILAAIAVEFIASGLRGLFPGTLG